MKALRAVFLLFFCPSISSALSNNETPGARQHAPPPQVALQDLTSRRGWLWQAPVGAVGAYAYGKLLYNALSVSGYQYPRAHEERVVSTVTTALTNAAAANTSTVDNSPLRVLEVGIGTQARLIRRGLYDAAIHQLAAAGADGEQRVGRVELTGLDFRLPSADVQNDAQAKLQQLADREGADIDFRTLEGSIDSSQLPIQDGFFDAVICCLTLCSVDDPVAAVSEMQRLLRPRGGTLGYVEHVAVDNDDKDHSFLAWQQKVFDPLQQRLADNCHLHRSTDRTIGSVLGVESGRARVLQQERFYVDAMWPVSCQSCGVVQRI